MAIYDIHWQAPLVVGTSVDAGWAVLPKPDGEWVVATSANRALYGRTAGVVLVGASSESPAPVAVTGIVDKGVAGLGTGSASWVRVTADGALERCTPSGSDDIVGYCRADGTLHLMCNFFTAAMINATGPAIPTGTGFRHISSGSEDAAAAKVNLTSSADVTVPASGVVKSNGAVLSSSNVNLTSEVTGTLPVASGGTGLTAVGTAYQLLRTNAGATAIEWGATNLASSNAVTGALPYTNGGTGLTALGSGLQVLRTNAGATAMEWATISSGASITGTDSEIVTKSGANGVTATNVTAGSGYITIGASPSLTGLVRTPYSGGNVPFWYVRSGSADYAVLEILSGTVTLASDAFNTLVDGSTTRVRGNSAVYLRVGSTDYMDLQSSEIRLTKPVIGTGSPYALDGAVGITITGNHTLTSSQYIYRYIVFDTSGSEGGAATMTFPNPSSDTYGYGKWIMNNSVATLTIKCGAGSVTCTIAAGRAAHVFFQVDATYDLTAAHTFP